MFEKSWIWDGAKHETKGCWISLWFCPFSELWRWVWVKKLSASKEWCCDSGKGKKENTSHPLFFYLKHWFSSRLFSGNSGISTINQLVATVGKLESKLRRSWAGKGLGGKAILPFCLRDIYTDVPTLDGSTSQFFNFTMIWKWYPFSKNCTSEFWFFLFLPSKWYMVGHSLVMLGSGSHCSSQSALQSWEQRTGIFSTVLNMDAPSVFHFQHTNQEITWNIQHNYNYKIGFVLDDFAHL